MGKKLRECLSKNKKCVDCLKSKDNGKGNLVTPGGKVKNISTYTISDWGCGKKCKCDDKKTLKGGSLINTLVNLSIPFGLVLAKEYSTC